MRPSIYVGLGGTGIRAIAQAKKLYEDVYGKGNIPKCIAFLAVDFNLADIKNPELLTSLEDDALLIPYNGSPREHYEGRVKRGAYGWVFPGNTDSLAHRISDGAGQVRTTGRFYTEYILNIVEAALQNRWMQVSNITYVNDQGMSVPCEEIDIHIVMSLAGGTGSGSFLNIAELINRKFGKRAHIFGYGVLHGVFRAMDPFGTHTPKVRVNAYSAIKDLDYLMHASTSSPVKFEINGAPRELTSPIFNEFFVIDNQTAKGNMVPNVKELCAALGTCLFASSGDMGATIQGGQSNNRWQQGSYGILHKKGWAQALGGCQVVYKGDLLAKIYGCKAAVELIRKMRQEGSDILQKAIDWTMSSKVREDEGNDLLINSIYSVEALGKLKGPKVAIQDSLTETRTTVQNYINTLVDFPEAKILAELQAEKDNLLKAELMSILSGDGGVGNAQKFLKVLTRQLGICRSEMEAEAATMKQQMADKAPVLEKAQKEYEEYCDKFFKTSKGKQERLDVVSATAKGMLKLALEIKRREAARDIFVHLLDVVEKYAQQIQAINELLENLSDAYEVELAASINQGSSPIFEYDLSLGERTKITIKQEDIGLAGFISKLPKSLLELDVDTELKPAIDAYVEGLPQAVAYRTKRLIDVIDALDDVAYAQLKDAIETKASSLLRLDNRSQENDGGRKPTELMVHEYMISLYCKGDEKCRLEKDHAFISQATGQAGCKFIPNPCEALRQKMFIFRAEYAFIPYCIEIFDEAVVEEYEQQVASANIGNATFNPHFDKTLYEEMRKQNFKLEPELPNEAMFYWVCGQIFGYQHDTDPDKRSDVTEKVTIMEKGDNGETIRVASTEQAVHNKYIACRKGKYYFWQNDSPTNGQDKRWYPIGGVLTDNRLTAYNNFKAITFPAYKAELHRRLKEIFDNLGEGLLMAKINELTAMGKRDYIDRLMCTNKNSATYYSRQTHESAFIDQEWHYIETEFAQTVITFKRK
ncbi:MAG: hypothetical protein IJN98_08115 [Alistipes sp.]|nr:hypothetical protein [Alistipes sp.]